MAYVNGQWVEDNDPFKTPYTTGSAEGPDTNSQNPAATDPYGTGTSRQMTPTANQQITAPVTTQDPSSRSGSFDYGNGITAKQGADGQWYYPWRAQGYQNLLGDADLAAQQQLQQYRQSGGKVAEDDRGALAQMSGQAAVQSGAPKFANSQPSFDDPTQRLIEDSALARYQHLQNPDPNSGTALYEQYARQLADTLKQPVYSPQDESVLKGGLTDKIMTERDQTKQRWLEEVQRRGLNPSSGPALQGLLEIDNHYNTLRTQVDAQFAKDAIQQTRDQRFQVGDVLSKLAGSEEGRLNDALNVARVPYGLTQDSFNRNQQLVSSAGNPASNLSSALAVYQAVQNNNRMDSATKQQALESVFEYIGGMLG